MSSIHCLLRESTQKLIACSDTPQLDAELLLAHVLQVARSYLATWPERELSREQLHGFQQLIERRMRSEPIAYLLGAKEFWSLTLEVNPDTLIPRPETELLVELTLKALPEKSKQRVVDLGTGSGAVALAIASERPHWEVWAVDCMTATLAVAQRNAHRLEIHNVIFQQSDWCSRLPHAYFHAVVSNPPYIASNDVCLKQGSLYFEPWIALASGADGLRDLQTIAEQARECLLPQGCLLMEHGNTQRAAITDILQKMAYSNVTDYRDIAERDRVVVAYHAM